MPRPVTLTTGQWADLSLDEICSSAASMGYDGLELALRPSLFDLEKAAASRTYCDGVRERMSGYGLRCWALSSHAIGKCVADLYDPRLDRFAPPACQGKPGEIRRWAIAQMEMVPAAAANMGVAIITSFMGSPIWRYFYSFPQTSEAMIEDGFDEVAELWRPILDIFTEYGIAFALEAHPSEIAFDYYTAERLIRVLDHPAFGLNFDPSHLWWQGIDPVLFLRDFAPYVRHVHMKDAAVHRDGRAGVLGSHLPFGDHRRGWDFRSVGRGDVDFESIIRTLNDIGYTGPLSVEWEDNGMDRMYGARESLEYVRRLQFPPSDRDFDTSIGYISRKRDNGNGGE